MLSRSLPARVALALSACLALPLSAQTTPAKPAAQSRQFGGAGEGLYKSYPLETLEAGKKIYTANCAFCHGGNAKGGESGPDLLRSIVVLHDENGETLGAFIHVGRPDKGMPAFKLPPDEVKDLAAFLHDSVRAAAQRGGYQILNIVVGDPKAGEAYFNGAGRCNTCHSVDKDLAHIGSRYDPVALQQSFVMPPRNLAPETAKVTMPDGKVIEGQVHRIDDFSITLTDADGNDKTIPRESPDVPKVELHDPLKAHTELLNQYTDSDIHNLTAYLLTLK